MADTKFIKEWARKLEKMAIPFSHTKSITHYMADPHERCKDFITKLLKAYQKLNSKK